MQQLIQNILRKLIISKVIINSISEIYLGSEEEPRNPNIPWNSINFFFIDTESNIFTIRKAHFSAILDYFGINHNHAKAMISI